MTDLVFDIGATRGRFALVNGGKLGEVYHVDTEHSAAGFVHMLGFMQDLTSKVKLRAVAGGIAGQLEGEEGKLILAPNLPKWIGLPVMDRMKNIFRCPVYIKNDVIMGAMGEAHYGVGVHRGVMAYFTVSTGVNAVRLVDGLVDSSIERYDIGNQIIAGADGRLQTLESLTGGAAFEKRRGRPPEEVRDSSVWAVEARNLALGLHNTILFWNPEVIVFNGSMMRDINLKVVRSELDDLPRLMPHLPRLEHAELGDVAGLHGAMVWLRQKGY